MPSSFAVNSSLEYPIVVVAEGLGAAEAVLEELDPSGDCRLRSLRFFSPGTNISFAFGASAAPKTHVFGRIAGYWTKAKRFVYEVELDEMLGVRAERIASLVARRRAELAWGQGGDEAADGQQAPPLARASIRADADFDLEYRVQAAWRHGTAANLSTGGMLMRAHEILVEGMALGVRITLPTGVLERCSEQLAYEKRWESSVLAAAQAMLRRPFKPLDLRARVVCHRSIAGTIRDYGVEFCDIQAPARAEIERYISALRFVRGGGLTQLASTA